MLDLGTLRIGVKADTDGAKSKLQGLQKETENVGKSATKSSAEYNSALETVNSGCQKVAIATAAFGAAAVGAFTVMAKSALEGYAAYEQNIGGINKLFGTAGQSLEQYAASVGKSTSEVQGKYESLSRAADRVVKDADEAWRTAGVSANAYMEQVTSFSASLITSLGNDTEKAASYAKMAMVDMSDNANTFGTNIADIQHAYQGFAKQNFTMLDNLKLGYGGTKEEMERLIQDANRVKEANGEMANLSIDSFADMVEAIHIIQEQMNIAGTTEREALTTIEGSVNSCKAAWDNWLAGLGNDAADISTLTANLVDSIAVMAQNVLPRIAQICVAIVQEIPKVFDQLKAQLPVEMQAIISVIQGILPAAAGVMAGLTAVFAATQVTAGIQGLIGFIKALWTVISINPVMRVVAIIGAVIGALTTLYATNETFRNQVNQIFSTLAPIVESAFSAIGELLTQFGTMLSTAVAPHLDSLGQNFSNLANAILPALGAGFSAMMPLLTTIGQSFMEFATTVISAVIPAITTILQGFTNFVNFITPLLIAALPVIQMLFQTTFSIIATVVTTVFNVISTIITTTMTVIQGIISAVLAAINGDWSGVMNALLSVASAIFNGVMSVISSIMSGIMSIVSSILSTIGSLWNSAWNALKSAVTNAMNAARSAVQSGISGIVSFFSSLPGRIVGALGNLGGLLVNAGHQIINGLLNGLKSAFGQVQSFIGGIGNWIAAHKGPKQYDLQLLIPNGGWIMESLATGLEKAIPEVKKALDYTASEISAYKFSLPNIEANFQAYKNRYGSSANAGSSSKVSSTNITVNNYSPKALDEKESAREYRRTMRQMAIA